MMKVGVEERSKHRYDFFIIIIYELISCDVTIYEVFYNLERGSVSPAYVIAIALVVFFFLWLIGYGALDFLKSINDA